MIQTSSEVAKFFWGEGEIVPSIDAMNAAFRIQKMQYSVCPVYFSIGFIHYQRNLWKAMNGWELPPQNSWGPAVDERQICKFCVLASAAIIVAENAVVGHLSFDGQNAAMKEYYLTHKEVFRCP